MKRNTNKLIALLLGIAIPLTIAQAADWYEASGVPAARALLNSADMRAEFASIETDIADKLPVLTGNGSKIVAVNSGGTALEAITSVPVAQGGTGSTTAAAARTALGLGSLAVLSAIDNDNWDTTDLAVANGGTGASTATAAATALGLGTGDSPQFTAVEVGDASDTTLARSGAGEITIEGDAIWNAGNDGTGSGLDADTLDGEDFTDFATREIDQNIQNGNYTLIAGDSGKHIYKASGGLGETITIPANSSVAWAVGTVITIINQGGDDLSIAITTDTLQLANSVSTGTRTLQDNGIATIIKVASTEWIISGPGVL